MFHPGEVVDGRYEVRERLGDGNSGEVYRVLDRETDRILVLKIQQPRFFEDTFGYGEYTKTFRAEVAAGAELTGVLGLARAVGGGRHLDREYFVMPDVDGRDLVDFAGREGAVSSVRTAAIVAQLSGIVGELHSRGWVHRDIKLENTLIAPDGRVWLIDLGSAVRQGTETMAVGTLGYTAPEVLLGVEASAASDVFSLGCVLFKLAIMNLPRVNETGLEPVRVPPFLDRLRPDLEALDPGLRAIGLRMIEWEPADRPQCLAEVVEELERVLPGPASPPLSRLGPDPVLWHWLAKHRR